MKILQIILNRTITIFQFLLVVVYLLFEELIWDRLIVPIDNYISSLKILQSLEQKLLATNRVVIVILFVALFVVVELVGIVAAGIALSGNVVGGVLLYLSKIPIAAFTFWMFGVVKIQLMTFGWFKLSYEKLMSAIEWIKSTSAYKTIMLRIHNLKLKIKAIYKLIKEQLPQLNGGFIEKTRLIYTIIKKNINK
jgi:hypothetical protein